MHHTNVNLDSGFILTFRNYSECCFKEFDNFAIGETNETYERYVFNSRDQKEDEFIDAYIVSRRTVNTCIIMQFLYVFA